MRNAISSTVRSAALGIGLVSALLVGCGDESSSDNTSVGDSGTLDTGTTDAATGGGDVGGTDAATDATTDSGATDAATDGGEMDASADAVTDAATDGGEMDASADAVTDATTDGGEMDATTDSGEMDAMPDVSDPMCGDGRIDDGETCDDGNTDDGDGCSMFCETCDDDEIASSGTSEEAYEFDYGDSVEGVVAQSGLDDWFQVLLLPGCMAVFEATYDTDAADITLVLLDAARMELATSEPTDTGAIIEWMSDSGGFFASTLFIGVMVETDGACVDYTIESVRRCG